MAFDEKERRSLKVALEEVKSMERHKESRGGGGSVPTTNMGPSYRNTHPHRLGS